MAKSVFCLVDSETQAEAIVDNLKAANFSHNDISVLFPDKSGTQRFCPRTKHQSARRRSNGRRYRRSGGRRFGLVGRHRNSGDSWCRSIHRGRANHGGIGGRGCGCGGRRIDWRSDRHGHSGTTKPSSMKEKLKAATFSFRFIQRTAMRQSAPKRSSSDPALMTFPTPKRKVSQKKTKPDLQQGLETNCAEGWTSR